MYSTLVPMGYGPSLPHPPAFCCQGFYNWKYMYLVNFLFGFVENLTKELEENHSETHSWFFILTLKGLGHKTELRYFDTI